jgi:hypothetical protein
VIQWTAFDEQTADEIRSRNFSSEAEIRPERPLDLALSLGKPALLILPGEIAGKVVLAQFRRIQSAPPAPDKIDSVSLEPSGFLGLSDCPVLRDDEPAASWPKWLRWFRLSRPRN